MTIKTKKATAATIAWLAFLALLAVVDGMERFVIPMGAGAALALALTTVWGLGLWKAGWIKL